VVKVKIKVKVKVTVKYKGKGHPRTGHEGPGGAYRYSCTLFFNLGAGWGWLVNTMPWPLDPQERAGTHCARGCVGPRASLDVCEKSPPPRI